MRRRATEGGSVCDRLSEKRSGSQGPNASSLQLRPPRVGRHGRISNPFGSCQQAYNRPCPKGHQRGSEKIKRARRGRVRMRPSGPATFLWWILEPETSRETLYDERSYVNMESVVPSTNNCLPCSQDSLRSTKSGDFTEARSAADSPVQRHRGGRIDSCDPQGIPGKHERFLAGPVGEADDGDGSHYYGGEGADKVTV